MIEKTDFGAYEKYSLTAGDMRVEVTTLGATVTSLQYKGREMALGYGTAQEYLDGGCYIGAVIGRYANRIAGAKFTLDGTEYTLTANEGKNQLHSGPNGFDKRRWTPEILCANKLRFAIGSPDGDNGFPGKLAMAVTYTVQDNTLRIDFEGASAAPTVFAPTSHLYFNLDGSESVLGTSIWLNADYYLPVNDESIPLEPAATEGDFDFKKPRPLGQNYDHCFITAGEHAAAAVSGKLTMGVWTDFPALQLYTGQFLTAPHHANQGFCLEPEFLPDSPNRPEFPSTVLRPGDHFQKYVEYRFFEKA